MRRICNLIHAGSASSLKLPSPSLHHCPLPPPHFIALRKFVSTFLLCSHPLLCHRITFSVIFSSVIFSWSTSSSCIPSLYTLPLTPATKRIYNFRTIYPDPQLFSPSLVANVFTSALTFARDERICRLRFFFFLFFLYSSFSQQITLRTNDCFWPRGTSE